MAKPTIEEIEKMLETAKAEQLQTGYDADIKLNIDQLGILTTTIRDMIEENNTLTNKLAANIKRLLVLVAGNMGFTLIIIAWILLG